MLCFEYYFLAFWVDTVFCAILCSNILLLDCWVWLVVFDADFICFHIVGHIVLTFVMCFILCSFSYSFGKWVWCFSVLYSVCEYESLNMSVALDCLSYITVFLCWHNMCVLLSCGYYFKTFHFQYVMSHWHLLYFGCFVVFTWCSMPVPIFCGLLCYLLYLIYAYHDHGRLSYWKLFINLCYSVFYCTFTILMHLPHFFFLLQCCLWFYLALTWLMFVIVCDISGLHSFLNLIKLIFVLCGAVFGSLLCAYSLADVSSIL